VPQFHITYSVAVDGLSLPMLVLSALLTFLAVIRFVEDRQEAAFYFSMLLLLQVGMNGVFLALDFVLFYAFWELVLVPMYFLIAQWGGARREYAAMKFFLYTLFGSVFMLVGIATLYLKTNTFDMVKLSVLGGLLPADLQWWLFLLFFLGFRRQGADLAAAHVASGRARRGTYGRFRDPCRRAPEDGHLRLPARLPADPAARVPPVAVVPGRAGDDLDRLRRRGRVRADRP